MRAATRVRDLETEQTYVLIRADVYGQMRTIIEGMTRRAGWDDSQMDDYEIYRKKT